MKPITLFALAALLCVLAAAALIAFAPYRAPLVCEEVVCE